MPSEKNEMLEGALYCALSFILFGSLLIFQTAGQVISIFSSLPMLLAAYRTPFKTAVMSLLASTFLVCLASPANSITYFTFYGLSGFLIGLFARKKFNPAGTIFFATFSCLAIFLIVILFLGGFTGSLPDGKFRQEALQVIDKLELDLLRDLEKSGKSVDEQKVALERFVQVLKIMFQIFYPSIFVFSASCFALIYYLLGQYLLLSYFRSEIVPFSLYSLPWKYIFVFIFSLGFYEAYTYLNHTNLMDMPDSTGGNLLRYSLNILISSLIFYYFQGLAIVNNYFERIKVFGLLALMVFLFLSLILTFILHNPLLALPLAFLFSELIRRSRSTSMAIVVVFVYSVLIPPFLLFLTLLGIFDSWFDFRKLEGVTHESNPA
ncbi:MAG: DUF2232 domain-containing protein [Candidatus Wallbacteria bacterium]|nr:DUF2232 domain-containing protein [Candidatus Wallbacteria bacterium]